tara:strand:+ start:1014 stop:1973 length:960 start_codon:yes stop_codon:yes gene_type:complete
MLKLLKELIMRNDKKEIIKVIFNLKGRTKYIEKYLNMIKKNYSNDNFFDILIINEIGNKLVKKISNKNFNIFNVTSKKKINGMNDIFREIIQKYFFLNKYKYCCFVEDDNFIFPQSLAKSKKFLEENNDYIACSGRGFIFSYMEKKYSYLNFYTLPNTVDDINANIRFQKYNKALCYYSLFRKKFFFKILKKITKITDDNMSEVFFNFLAVKFGKIKELNCIYLARKYPRPKIYNIPDKNDWIKNNSLLKDINTVIRNIDNNYLINLSNNSVFKYLSLRFFNNKKITIFSKLIFYFKKYLFYLSNRYAINNFINNWNHL